MTRRSSEDWRALIKAQQSSGLNQTQFCKQQGLSPKYFSLRKGKQSSEKGSSSFVQAKRSSSIELMPAPSVSLYVCDMRIQLETATPAFISELVRCLA
jgi:hypothetical protein